ncbi:hypothetical protein BU16DRAFT_283007 [Lophium mytilinum]|uniref:Uncharacterized protein n=1 Tax=Lophium mytilinum TaxID=390894 RepID=A0A6A6R4W8_9PEZI|nr:hypothetical protein BU16DRAFT_283007 [Lophium mytilinum]
MYKLKGGTVPLPRWILVFRLLQLIFAVLIIALTSYSISINKGGPVRASLSTSIQLPTNTPTAPPRHYRRAHNRHLNRLPNPSLHRPPAHRATPHLRPPHRADRRRHRNVVVVGRVCGAGGVSADFP